jgi:hypothetical protein
MSPFGAAPLFRLEVEVGPPEPLDPASGGPVRLIAITGGRVLGGLSGRILPGGTDWQRLRESGALEIEARYMLELDDGLRIELQSRGLRAAGASGFWSSIWLTTPSAAQAGLNDAQFLALGRKRERFVEIEVYALPGIGEG